MAGGVIVMCDYLRLFKIDRSILCKPVDIELYVPTCLVPYYRVDKVPTVSSKHIAVLLAIGYLIVN